MSIKTCSLIGALVRLARWNAVPRQAVALTAVLAAASAFGPPDAKPRHLVHRVDAPGLEDTLDTLVLSPLPGGADTPPAPGQVGPAPLPGGQPPQVRLSARSEKALARIRRCESGSNYRARSGSGRYGGAYQMDRHTFASVGGSGDPAAASPAEQDHRARLLYRQRGTQPWPVCA